MYKIDQKKLLESYIATRKYSEQICEPLANEDYVPQPIMDVSPPKWHLAHTTWFFEQLVLLKYANKYQEFHPDFAFLFNSYYNNLGERTLRQNRGFMSRPTVTEVYGYRDFVNKHMLTLLQSELPYEALKVIEIGLNHEQQHQELLAYDIKYILGNQLTFPKLGNYFELQEESHTQSWIEFEGGLHKIGASINEFSYDNELPQHEVNIAPFSISNRLVTNGEYLEFIQAGGYSDYNLWHAEGWDFLQRENIQAPLYWHLIDNKWFNYTYAGLQPVNMDLPVQHISYYEAFAYSQWLDFRLPTEHEWEVAANQLKWGQLWEWTSSAYLPYPGYIKAPGALGEYNGKFMLNQNVLRGASIGTPLGHERSTYRNFFTAGSRWIFSGIRLVK